MLAALPTRLWAKAYAHAGPVARAFAAAGGRDLLARVRVLSWTGTAHAMLGRTPVHLHVETRIEPFARARSDTWLIGDDRETMRTVMIERDSAFVVQDGAQTALPAAQARVERQRLGAYAYLLLAPAFVSAAGSRRLNATHDGFPPIALTLGATGRIASADYAIAVADGNRAAIRQHLTFSGSVSAQGVHFPRMTTITENGRPSLRLRISDFSVELSRA